MSAGNGGLAGLTPDELRAAVRAVLREVIPPGAVGQAAAASSPAPSPAGESVSLRTDAELDAFVRRVAALCEDPRRREALRTGRSRFRLAGAAGSTSRSGGDGPSAGVLRIDSGAVTERKVAQAAKEGLRLVLGRRAVLTPLARDRARTLGVAVEKEK